MELNDRNKDEFCEDCKWCFFSQDEAKDEDEKEETGECRRNPPVLVAGYAENAYSHRWEWPRVPLNGFCGQWQHEKPITPAKRYRKAEG
jgi:hypothetical protein